MRNANVIMMAVVVSAGTLAMAAPTITADNHPQPLPPMIQCPPGWPDLGDGYGGLWCSPTGSCPSGTFQDANGNGTVDYGECMIGPNAAAGTTPTWDYNTTPGSPTNPPATQPPATQPPATNPPSGTNPPAATNPPATNPSGSTPDTAAPAAVTDAPTTVDLGPVGPPSLAITYAQVECNGMIHVEYDTSANPAPSTDTTHLIAFHAASAPADYVVSEITGQAPFGSYSFDHLGSVDDTYRLWVTVMFDTIDPEVPTLTDWADVIPPADC